MIQHIIATIGLFVGILYTFINALKMYYYDDIPKEHSIAMALGWTIFISAMWVF